MDACTKYGKHDRCGPRPFSHCLLRCPHHPDALVLTDEGDWVSSVTVDRSQGASTPPIINFALTLSKSEVVALVADHEFLSLPGGLHFGKEAMTVTVGGVNVSVSVHVTLLTESLPTLAGESDAELLLTPATRRRLSVRG